MLSNDYGYIVPICSVAAFTGSPKMSDYCASKAAAFNFSDSLRAELRKQGKSGISVIAVCPWHIATGMFQGFKTRLHWLVPALKPSSVAAATVEAIANKEYFVVVPRLLGLSLWMK